jgi:hypothetical protein
VHNTNKVVNSNPAHGEVYSMQHYMIKFVGNLWKVDEFFPGTSISSTNKTNRHDIAEILLKVVLNNNPNPNMVSWSCILYYITWQHREGTTYVPPWYVLGWTMGTIMHNKKKKNCFDVSIITLLSNYANSFNFQEEQLKGNY